MATTFSFKEYPSSLFGVIKRPVAQVLFAHKKEDAWQPVTMLIDTGADYTLLPRFLAATLGITLSKDCRVITTQGVGGKNIVYLLKEKMRVRIGAYERNIPLGFLATDSIPPLLGRQEFFETFRVVFENYQTTFS